MATYTKGSSTDTWAFQGAMTVSGTMAVTGAQTFTGSLALGTIADAGGLALTDAAARGVGLFTELPSTGTAISGGKVIYGVESRLVVNKDQTTNADVSLFALSGHLRVKQDLPNSSCFGLFAYFEQSGTVAGSFGGALRAKVEGEAGLTMASLFGIEVDGHVASGATISDFPAIKVATDVEGTTGQKAWTSILKVGTAPSVAYLALPDDGTIASVTNGSILNDISATTNAGFIKVTIGAAVRYLPLYELKA